MTPVREVHVVLPGGVDDPAAPSGGNTYDLRVCAYLTAAGWLVRQIAAPGDWPRPTAAGSARLAEALAAIPVGAVVLLDGLVACAAPEAVLSQAGRLRLAVLVHLPLADETGLAPAQAADLDDREARTLRAAAAVIATSDATGQRLLTRHALAPARVRVAAPGVDPAPVTAASDHGSRLLCVASVTPRKGHDVLVAALARLAGLRWNCVCAGPLDRDPDHADRVRSLVVQHGLDHRVRWTGPLGSADLAARYASADLLVLPSRAEPYGMVVTEALARGVPVLGTTVDGVPEALGHAPDGTLPGLLVPPDDPSALAVALHTWLTEPGPRRRLRAAAAQRRTTLHDWAGTAAAIAAVLEEIGACA